ncbi:hypothetical protein CDAR_551411 [Caerostris darwini]|uniref:Uncharacterized protein n=1 Tax=Caerostris darwini TaxID=1538125 RepID=A0AAV4V7B5_9ARAC|nr:hypothetical protein CDAR_551411 [Caerostris darwini]
MPSRDPSSRLPPDTHYPLNAQFISTRVPNKESDFAKIKMANFHPFSTRKGASQQKRGNLLWSLPISGPRPPIVPAGSPSVTQSDAIKRSLFVSPAFLQ